MVANSQTFDRDRVRRYEYDDTVVLAADLGPGVDGSVDVVDGTALVVTDDDQFEFPVPEGEVAASISNGVVSIEVRR
jgi:hypothetical protein